MIAPSPVFLGGKRRLRVLVAEDVELSLHVVSAMLYSIGVDVLRARDGQEALEAFANGLKSEAPVDLILMDVMMPRLTGVAATRRIRALESQWSIECNRSGGAESVLERFSANATPGRTLPPYLTRINGPVSSLLHDGDATRGRTNWIKDAEESLIMAAASLEAMEKAEYMDLALLMVVERACARVERALRAVHPQSSTASTIPADAWLMQGVLLHTPIVALTAFSDRSAREECMDSGMDEFVSKPFVRKQLEEMIQRAASGEFIEAFVADQQSQAREERAMLRRVASLLASTRQGLSAFGATPNTQ